LLFAPAPPPVAAQGLPAPPIVTLDPGCGGQAIEGDVFDTQIFRLRNFTPNSEVTIVWGQEPPQTVVVGEYGALDTPPLTFKRSGTQIQVFETSDPGRQASASLLVPCTPSIRISPSCDAPADPAAPRPLAITVEGRNWEPFFGAVTVFLNLPGLETDQPVSGFRQGTPDETLRSFSVVLDQAPGRIPAPLMALPAGQYFVVAVQGQSNVRVDVDFVVPCAQLQLQPSCGEAGRPLDIYDILVTGSGFRPGLGVELTFDTFGQQQVFQLNIDLPPPGELRQPDGGEVRIEPFRRPDGTYFVTARQGSPDHVFREATAVFTVPCPPDPVLTIDPLCGPPQLVGDDPRTYSLAVNGQNLAPGLLSIIFDPDQLSGVPAEQFDLPVNNGSVAATITPLRRQTGVYQIAVQQEPSSAPLPLSLPFNVPCAPVTPTLSVACDPPDSDQPELAQVVVEGAGFFEDGPVELNLGTAPTEIIRTDAAGSFTRLLPAADLADGPFNVIAGQRDAVGVVAQATAAIVLPCGTREPLLQFVPTSGSPGVVIQVRGFSFRPNSTVDLRWNRGIGSTQPFTVTVAADGTFTQRVLIFHHDFGGMREMTAASGAGPIELVEPALYVVSPGRGSPPVFVDSPFPGSDTLVIRR
jgi:hypothetical protein